ncbi:hypothetical protein M0R45_004252 [Rubus argutus]|uniref:Uncharacterized protein n=1 Tax=Rubus argutus TaxID=59490 RepID=A0AAW1YJ95_RUBAR
MHLHVEVQEEQENDSVEHRVETPSADSVTAAFHEMHQQNPNMAGHIAAQKQHLAVDHEGEAGPGQPDCDPDPVRVHNRIHQRGGEDGQHLKRLRKLEPHERHESEDGVVEELEGDQFAASENREECADHVEESGDVVHVRPEEDPTRRAGPEREAQEPLERGFGPPPEPPGFADFGDGGERDAGEDGEGHDGHDEAVDCGYGSRAGRVAPGGGGGRGPGGGGRRGVGRG